MKKGLTVITTLYLIIAVPFLYIAGLGIKQPLLSLEEYYSQPVTPHGTIIPSLEKNTHKTEVTASGTSPVGEVLYDFYVYRSETQKGLAYVVIIFTVILYVLIIVWYWHVVKLRRKDFAEYQLFNLSFTKIHNFGNNYTELLGLMDDKQYEAAHEYIENSSAYYSKILHKHRDSNWTIANELELLHLFYNAEKIIYSDVEIVEEILIDNINEVIILPDLFTTFLHNSLRHAFRNKTGHRVFKIKVSRKRKKLLIEISDNGEGKDDKTLYFPKDRRSSGLNVADARILNEWHQRTMYIPFFWQLFIRYKYIDVSESGGNKGTVFNLSFPYETTT